MKYILGIIMLLSATLVQAQQLAPAVMEKYVGMDKARLTRTLADQGYAEVPGFDALTASVAGKMTKLTRESCKAIAFKKANSNDVLVLVYNPAQTCVCFSQGFNKASDRDFLNTADQISRSGYTCANNAQVVKPGEKRIFTKGAHRFLLMHNEPAGGYAVAYF